MDNPMKAALRVAACVLLAPLFAGGEESGPRHLIYLHGRIVQERQDPRPRHAEFGYYELEQILAAFRERGFVVSGGIRPKDESPAVAADRVVGQVRGLVASGVPARRITVVGASMGAWIALLTATRLQDPALSFCVIGACLSQSARQLQAEHGKEPVGRILAIRERSDETSEPCPGWSADGRSQPTRVVREIVLDTGLRHGFLYRPLPEWVAPVVEWATQR